MFSNVTVGLSLSVVKLGHSTSPSKIALTSLKFIVLHTLKSYNYLRLLFYASAGPKLSKASEEQHFQKDLYL